MAQLATDHNEHFGLFNAYLGTHLPSLPDKHWFARMSEPYIYFPPEK